MVVAAIDSSYSYRCSVDAYLEYSISDRIGRCSYYLLKYRYVVFFPLPIEWVRVNERAHAQEQSLFVPFSFDRPIRTLHTRNKRHK